MCFLISCLRSCWKENGNKLKTHTHTRNREPPDFEDEGAKSTTFFDEILCYPKNQTEHFHKGTTCNHDPVTTQKETAFPNSCNTKSPTPPTAVLTAVMALSSLLWAAARSFRCWLLLFIAVLSSSAVCLTVSQTAQNQKLDPTILNSVSVKIIWDCLLVVSNVYGQRVVIHCWRMKCAIVQKIDWSLYASTLLLQFSLRLHKLHGSCLPPSLQPPSAHHGTFAIAHAHPMHRFASPLFHLPSIQNQIFVPTLRKPTDCEIYVKQITPSLSLLVLE